MVVDDLVLLTLPPHPLDGLVVVLEVPRQAEPAHVRAGRLQVEPVASGGRVGDEHGDVAAVERVEQGRVFLLVLHPQRAPVRVLLEYPVTIVLELVEHQQRLAGQLLNQVGQGVELGVMELLPLPLGAGVHGTVEHLSALDPGRGRVRRDDQLVNPNLGEELLLQVTVYPARLVGQLQPQVCVHQRRQVQVLFARHAQGQRRHPLGDPLHRVGHRGPGVAAIPARVEERIAVVRDVQPQAMPHVQDIKLPEQIQQSVRRGRARKDVPAPELREDLLQGLEPGRVRRLELGRLVHYQHVERPLGHRPLEQLVDQPHNTLRVDQVDVRGVGPQLGLAVAVQDVVRHAIELIPLVHLVGPRTVDRAQRSDDQHALDHLLAQENLRRCERDRRLAQAGVEEQAPGALPEHELDGPQAVVARLVGL